MTSTTLDTTALNDTMRERYTPPKQFDEVKLTPAQQSEWDVTKTRFLTSAPAFGHVLYTMMSYSDGRIASFTNDPRLAVAATDGRRMILRVDAFFKLTLDERVFVLAHEVCHAIMDHCGQSYRMQRRGTVNYSDGNNLPYVHLLMNMALDLVINDLLIESSIGKFPTCGLHDRTLGKAHDDALDVYRRLFKECNGGKGKIPGDGRGFDVLLEPGQLGDADGDGDGKGGGKGDMPGAGGSSPDKAMGERSEGEWKTAVSAGMTMARLQGKLPGALEAALGEVVDPKVSWQEHIQALLARKVGAGGFDWRRPDRQMISRPFMSSVTSMGNFKRDFDAVFSPGRSGKGVGCVVVGIDTSGSIRDREVNAFFAEMTGMLEDLRPQRLVVVWCDAKVQRVDEVEDASDLVSLRQKGAPGRGGTAFEPVFDEVSKMGLTPDALVYLTDGYGSFPQNAPAYPVIWGSIALSADKFPFGDVVSIKL
jgi:predicted metal-dependent peptidase